MMNPSIPKSADMIEAHGSEGNKIRGQELPEEHRNLARFNDRRRPLQRLRACDHGAPNTKQSRR